MKGALFSSDSWHNITFIAGEVRNPQRNIGLSLVLGTLIVTVIYVLANVMYLAVVPLHGIAFAASDRVGVVAAEHIFGSSGTVIIAVMIMISTFGCNNGLILAGARVLYHGPRRAVLSQGGCIEQTAGARPQPVDAMRVGIGTLPHRPVQRSAGVGHLRRIDILCIDYCRNL